MELNENKFNLDKNKEAYVESTNIGILGCVNGMLFYDFIYPLIVIAFIQVILGASFTTWATDNLTLYKMILSLSSSIMTLVAAIIIARPRKLIKAYKGIGLDDVRLMITTFLLMTGVTIGYNLLLTLIGFNDGSGNTNQTAVEDYISTVPILSLITFVFIGPVLEEITFRYFLFGSFRKINPKFAIFASGFVFMLVHGVSGFLSDDANILRELMLLPPYMFSGCLLANAYNKSDNLLTSTGVHIFNNALSFIITIL